jgi:hypothetical protein
MAAGIEPHVGERVPHLPRAGEDPNVIPVGEHSARSPERPVHGPGEARGERLHPAPEGVAVLRLDDQVRVIGLDRVVDEPEVVPLVAAPEGGLELADDVAPAQGRQTRPHLQRHIVGLSLGQRLSAAMAHERVRPLRSSAAVARDGEASEVECALSRSSHLGVMIGP